MECPKCRVENKAKKQKIYWMVKLSAICLIVFVIACILLVVTSIDGIRFDSFYGKIIETFLRALLVASPVLAIIASLKINISDDLLGNNHHTSVIIGTTVIILCFLIGIEGTRLSHKNLNRLISGANLNGLGKAILIYANDNNGQLPKAENWCDLLIINADVSPNQFVSHPTDVRVGESSYALNNGVVGIAVSEIPSDMVVLFETTLGIGKSRKFIAKDRDFNANGDYEFYECNKKYFGNSRKVYKDRWNQIGGPESLALSKNNQVYGCNVLFGNWDVKFTTLSELANLKWSLKENFQFEPPQPDFSPKYSLKSKTIVFSVIGIIVISCVCFILYEFNFKKYWLFFTVLGSLSSGICYLFALVAELSIFGVIAVCVLGFVIGMCYVAVLAKTSYSIKQPEKLKGYAVSLGMATGVICSMILQIVLIMIDTEKLSLTIMTGLFFGIIDGAILGAIGGRIIKKYYTIIPKINEMEN